MSESKTKNREGRSYQERPSLVLRLAAAPTQTCTTCVGTGSPSGPALKA
jgi:hypothetical protein